MQQELWATLMCDLSIHAARLPFFLLLQTSVTLAKLTVKKLPNLIYN